ncbi:MAG TPA: dynamin family protein [Myxococcales bacterium]|nr:dynamin family protein [Myxococcales bacterium]
MGAGLDTLVALAREFGARHVAEQADALARRTAEGRFFVACVGQFKRGKSTLLNALVEQPVLPVGVVPVTAVVTILRHGPQPRAVLNGVEEIPLHALADYVTEEGNPGNAKAVRAVEVALPSPILQRGMCLVDTPGIGSVFAANTDATRAFVPHIDAALVVLGADPPISGDELALVEDVSKHVGNLLVVLNKADRLSDDERRQASEFAQRVLVQRLSRPIGILEVSATQPGTRDWPKLENALVELAARSGADLVDAAQKRGTERLRSQLRHELQERRDALLRPLEESERRLAALEKTIAAAERSMKDLGVLLTAEQQRLSATFEANLNEFLKSIPATTDQLLREISDDRKIALAQARTLARDRVQAWHAQIRPVAERLYSAAMDRFVALANDFLARGVTAEPLDQESGFRVPPRAFFTEMLSLTGRSPLRWIADVVRGKRGMRSQVERYFAWLLEVNASRVASDLTDRVAESRRLLEKEIRARLREVATMSHRALEAARKSRAAGDSAVKADLERLDLAVSRLSG